MDSYLKWALNRVNLYNKLNLKNKKEINKIYNKLDFNKKTIKKIKNKENKINFILDKFYFEDIEKILNKY